MVCRVPAAPRDLSISFAFLGDPLTITELWMWKTPVAISALEVCKYSDTR